MKMIIIMKKIADVIEIGSKSPPNLLANKSSRQCVVSLLPPWKQLKYVNKLLMFKRKWNHTMAMKMFCGCMHHSLVLKSSCD